MKHLFAAFFPLTAALKVKAVSTGVVIIRGREAGRYLVIRQERKALWHYEFGHELISHRFRAK